MMENKMYKFFADIIFKHTGIHYPEQNYYQLKGRLKNLATYMNLESIEEVYQKFQKCMLPEERDFLLDAATNNETSFFRDKHPFEQLIPIIDSMGVTKNVNIWSAACSKGQEVYSILMTLKEKRPDLLSPGFYFRASDISPRALEQAQSGVYSQLEIQRGLPIQLMAKYFTQPEKSQWKISEELTKKVDFKCFNLFTGIYERNKFDLIFCRNVLIYQKFEEKKKIVQKLRQALKPGGCLILGSSESLIGMDDGYESHRFDRCSVFKKPKDASGGLSIAS